MKTNDKDVNKLLKVAMKAGWTVEQQKKHFRVTSTSGESTFISGTTGSKYSILHVKNTFKKMGLEI
jgi:uncharacterized protein YcnI